jgi:hypothetical protein
VGRTVNLSRSDSIGDNRWMPVIPAKRSVNRTSRVVFAGVGGSRQARAARFIVATILLLDLPPRFVGIVLGDLAGNLGGFLS